MSVIKEYITEYLNNSSEENLMELFARLATAEVWIPCNTVMSDADQARVEKMLAEALENGQDMEGTTFECQDEMRMVPDILQNDKGDFCFPVFTSVDEMGEYGENFSNVESSFQQAMKMAENNPQSPTGIVINAFSQPLFIPKDYFGIIYEVIEKRREESSELDIVIPLNFMKADPMEGDPEGSIPFSLRTEETDAILFYFRTDFEGDFPFNAGDALKDAMIQKFEGTSESLVEMDHGKTAEGMPDVYFISKIEKESAGSRYKLRYDIKLPDKTAALEVLFDERPGTGSDEESEGHPLTMARNLVEFVRENN